MEEKHSWLDGPQVPGEFDNPDHESDYPGQALGLTPSGPGSQATLLRRSGGILIDWVICIFLTVAFTPFYKPSQAQLDQFGDSFIAWQSFVATLTPVIFLVLGTVSVWLFARTPGQWAMKMGVARIDDPSKRVGFVRAFVRSLLTIFLLPPAIVDSDMRGMHDRATGTAVILG
ncbi:RDD family protein [Corynebacterium lactis]|uniref:Membrane protein n=1 Tax=Corynebacterium lactis RW2-5 TaxID=1408189 RepID=A0A0K2H0X3_9CORY|nr:RDD family protein [Corynebacterium lactis]ALA67690.1 membrane protein [Corynebacterium lactis RW2-5]